MRTRSPVAGLVGVWVVGVVSGAFWLFESGLNVLSPILLLCLVLSTVLAVPYLIDRLVAPQLAVVSPVLATLVFPLARVVGEYLNARFSPAGNIFGSLAATQHDNLPLLQIAAITGSYGVSFLIAWFAAASNTVWERQASWPRIRTVVAPFTGVFIAVLVGGGIRLAVSPPSAPTVRVAGVSPSSAALAERTALSEREARAGAKIIVWPEVGAGARADDKDDLIARVATLARRHGVYLEMGLGVLTRHAPYARNQAILVGPRGQVIWTYDKARPVPGMDKLAPGDGRVPTVDTPYGRLANLICFDADFPELARQAGSDGVDLMLVPSNDWREFGTVHTQKATLRAVENGYSLVRPDTNGLAQVVDFQGRVLGSSDFFITDRQTVVANVPTKGERTVYAMIGDVFAWLSLTALVLLTGAAVLVRRSERWREDGPDDRAADLDLGAERAAHQISTLYGPTART